MNTRNERREAAIERMADHLLAEGLGAATLRPLALAAGTSDRMLLYYFDDKEALLTAVLERIAARMLDELERAIPITAPRPFGVLLEQVWTILGSTRMKSYMDIWLEIASGAARQLQPHRAVAGAIMDGYLSWVAHRLQREDGQTPLDTAAIFLSTVQGVYLLTAIGRPEFGAATLARFRDDADARSQPRSG